MFGKEGSAEAITPEDEATAQPHVVTARKLLHHRLRVVTRDGRTILGDFHCMDQQQNVILLHAVEAGVNPHSGEYEERMMGQVMVPLAQRTSCEVEVSWAEEARVRALVAGEEWPLPS
jgi:small nuclear ribonucleoprotein (snRNP)-like protein|mmetsp:Transcript_42495/g.76215  ORF Transcript_42495/g.76215 Transcript_42495/m.76215 type:complete len:118 (-) Transcript_42495:204-557(-)|eukprot:CAMPEP_0177769612 /NCGR_PEP_ID=MMETSP0491_2-20121128/10425_1 /TAXON_ID=63592 /ORGANISM="Tetraselmis chuii, Strain PLY429" /LENGTH=117 /DNA_ID=CAMNT_0019286653 /DNA_START=277 /DNA_END=630 /DNA_ORIENTATION=-